MPNPVGAEADLTTLFQTFKKEHVAPILRAAGLRLETPARFVHETGGVRQGVYLHAQGNCRNSPHRSFTFEIAAWDPQVDQDLPFTGFRCRLGYLKVSSDAWFYLDAGNAQTLGELVELELQRYVLPLLHWATSLQHVEHLKQLLTQGPGQLAPQLRALIPGFGRDFEGEFQALWTDHVSEVLCAAGFVAHEGDLFRTLENGITQAYLLRGVGNDARTFPNVEGMLAIHVPTPAHPEPTLPVRPPVWWLVSDTWVISGHSKHFSRYILAAHTHDRMGAWLRSELQQHLLPFFDRHSRAAAIHATRQIADAHIQRLRSTAQAVLRGQ